MWLAHIKVAAEQMISRYQHTQTLVSLKKNKKKALVTTTWFLFNCEMAAAELIWGRATTRKVSMRWWWLPCYASCQLCSSTLQPSLGHLPRGRHQHKVKWKASDPSDSCRLCPDKIAALFQQLQSEWTSLDLLLGHNKPYHRHIDIYSHLSLSRMKASI